MTDTHRFAFDAPPAGPVKNATDAPAINAVIAIGRTWDFSDLNTVVSLLGQTPALKDRQIRTVG